MEGSASRRICAFILAALPLCAGQPALQVKAQAHAEKTRPCIFDRATLRTTPGTCRPTAILYPAYVKGRVRRSIYDSALTFGIPYSILLQIAHCESGLNPHAANGPHFGLFQFLPDTFTRGAHSLRHETGIVARSYWNPLDSSYVAGYLFATGHALRWSCENRVSTEIGPDRPST